MIDLNVRRAQYLHNAWKKHQDAEYWVDIDLAIRKGLTFYQIRSNAIILQGTLPSYCIPKVVRLKTGEVLYKKAYMPPRPPPKILPRHDWDKGEVPLGSTVDQQPEGEVARQAKSSQPTQPNSYPNHERTVRPVVCRLDSRIGLESCSTTRRRSCSTVTRRSCQTSKILPTSPTNPKAKL